VAKVHASNGKLRKAQVLEVAIRIFSERGYRGTSIIDLAEGVGVGKSSLYHYIRSKQDLLVECYDNVLEESLAAERSILARGLPPADALKEVLVDRIVYTCENRRLLQIFFEEEAELPAASAVTLLRHRREYADALVELVERGLKDGSLQISTTPKIVVNAMLGAANWVYKWYDPAGAMTPEELANMIAETLLNGIRTNTRRKART
jgi:TetR/AcrR family transcriptional regulator, cholesterol catabolism regulator